MADVMFIAVIFVMFAAAWLLVRACERIIGAEEVTEIQGTPDEAGVPDEAAA